MAYVTTTPSGRYQVRWKDPLSGKERAKGGFTRKRDATDYGTKQEAAKMAGTYVDPTTARMTLGAWCDQWLARYGTHRASTVKQAGVHIKVIKNDLGHVPLTALRATHIKSWVAQLHTEGRATSYTYALHRRLSQVLEDAVHDGVLPHNPCSRRTSPPAPKQRPYVATEAQVWALYEAFAEGIRPAVLLGAFAGLRVSEATGLEPDHVDFLGGVIYQQVQFDGTPLKSETSYTPIPVGRDLTDVLAQALATSPAGTILTNQWGRRCGPWVLEQEMRRHRARLGLPAGFRFQDLRHFFASYLIAQGLDFKVVQARLRHASAKITMDTYGHLRADNEDVTKHAIGRAFAARRQVVGGQTPDDFLTISPVQDHQTVVDLGERRAKGR